MRSSVEIYSLRTGKSRVAWQTEMLVESPHFTHDDQALILNSEGLMYCLSLDGDEPVVIDTGFANRCNNDHGLSPDGATLAITDKAEHGRACIYTLPIDGGTPTRVSPHLNSYYHGWSPDGSRITYTGIHQRDRFGIYTSTVDGCDELAIIEGRHVQDESVHGRVVHDGPDYSACGQWIWFNSNRSGSMQIWRARTNGDDLQQMTDDGFANWFPHPSPNGKAVVILSYDAAVGADHPRDQAVCLRLMPAEGGMCVTLFDIFGGQGTMNVPNWTRSGDEFAYVRYAPAS